MELGKGKLLRTGLNALYQAIHPIHGLAWTDGNQVVLTDVHLQCGEARFGDSKVIGRFEHVYGVSWAPPGTADMPALLAVQHKQHVTVWQLRPSSAETSKWLMSQTCEIRESSPLLPQGCVWHPKSAVLTVLTARDVSICHNVHCDSSQVKADHGTQSLIHCACWTQDGQRLVVAVGSSLHSYIWDSAQKTLHRCSFCSVFDVDSCVRCIGATVGSQVAIATELPLDKICGLHASETLDVPPGSEDTCLYTSPVFDEVHSEYKRAVPSETNSETSVSSSSYPLDLTHIQFDRSKSEGNALICLKKKDNLTGTGLDSSHLVLVTFENEVTQTRKVTIPGILVPDLIAFNLKAHVVAVASNTCNIIFIYSVIPSFMPNIQQIHLERSERPKGICFLTDKLLLILVGNQKSTDLAFLPPSESDEYVIRLIVREIMSEDLFPVTLSKNRSGSSTCSTLLNKAERKKLIEHLSPDFCHLNRGLLLTANNSSHRGGPGSPLIKEIKRPPSSVWDGSKALEALDAKPVNWAVTLPRSGSTADHTSTPEPPNFPQRENLQREIYQLSEELKIISRNLTEVQQCLSELTDFRHNEKKSSPVYPLAQELPYVHITYQKPYGAGSVVEKRDVLLCSGKLRLQTVQQTFGLSLIEMLHDSRWILLSADSEGFIPLTFTGTQEIVVRDGSSGLSNILRDSLFVSKS
ncbi:PREDICTED: WD repeat and coiled-coil-containing protein [Hipposideros armiger]|uniref:WD repeat and coiled-coil-containing protein n=1 Tax=Hipposideros armiger TaxID=186990 RepID=A0A8B7RYE4_HIPAR|nr:PREDICTED: WD repeat and coiled-coil-containing protein [Hipposideros armiger]XP_019506212.1 PREDICTED: WD repeat and coiled-coil-containing protein [Hipposideros armiger]XP_019506279.1 PREDICTED: WD repeat and coiled-coil-containing protein [Hipposideros armiger]